MIDARALQYTDDFVKNTLPGLLAGKATLRCHFVTYRYITDFPAGEVAVDKPGLSIHVSEGGDTSFIATAFLLVKGDPRAIEQESAAQLEVAVDRSSLPQNDEPFMLVVYAGLTAFRETLDFIQDVRKRSPSAQIVAMSCDCDPRAKSMSLEPLLKDGTINAVTWCHVCGGRDDMAKVLRGVIEHWQPAPAA